MDSVFALGVAHIVVNDLIVRKIATVAPNTNLSCYGKMQYFGTYTRTPWQCLFKYVCLNVHNFRRKIVKDLYLGIANVVGKNDKVNR